MEVIFEKQKKSLSEVAVDTAKSIFNKETLIPVSFILALVAPVMFVTNLSARVESLESQINVLKTETVTKEVFQLKMENFDTKLDQVIKLIEDKQQDR